MATTVVVMAAGQGTRMKSDVPKVLHEVAGKPMLLWVLDAAQQLNPDRITVVVGYGAEQVRSILPDGVDHCVQEQQLGTGHAVQTAVDHIGDVSANTVVVLSGDTPALTGEALIELVSGKEKIGAAASLLTAELPDARGYGRILRDGWDRVVGIVEHKDANAKQREIREINAGMYAFDGAKLLEGLSQLSNVNSQGEYYLTDVITHFSEREFPLVGIPTDEAVIAGVNSQWQLAEANRLMRHRIATDLMQKGVWIQDPFNVYLTADVVVEPGAFLYTGVHLEGACRVEEGASVGPDTFARDSSIGAGARVWYSVLREAEIGPEAEVGPYVSLRPGTVLGRGAKAGTFVEMKNTTLGDGAKVPHLSYMGDAEIGDRANIGAGSITCNYDGVDKHRTEVGEGAFVGSDTMLVAPVRIGKDAVTGAGSTITKDVADGALAVERADQREIPGYAARLAARKRKRNAD